MPSRCSPPSLKTIAVPLLTVAIAFIVTSPVAAQYFGRNKVQYEDFDFRVLETRHFDLYYYELERSTAVRYAAELAERWYDRFSELLQHEFTKRQPLIMYSSHPHFRQTNVVPGLIGPGVGGVTEPLKRRAIMPFAGPLAETNHVLGHELVHTFQYSMRGRGLNRAPLWLVEGMAEYLSVGPTSPLTAMWLRDALERDELPDLDDLNRSPYRYGHAFWSFLGGMIGDSAPRFVFAAIGAEGPRSGLQRVTEVSADSLVARWHRQIENTYGPLRRTTAGPDRFGTLLFGGAERDLNVAPSLSPDGRRILFLSARSEFAIEMFLGDAQTGEVVRKIVGAPTGDHFDNLNFLNSSGAWARDGTRFAFTAISGGQPTLVIARADDGSHEREITLGGLGEIFSPTWSPDGRRIAFSALVGGLTDLFVYDLERDSLQRLTDDPYADLQPAWSPDGGRLAFVTDRFGADLALVRPGPYRLALFELDTHDVRPITAESDGGKQISPQWSPDGSALYFVGTPDGIPNVYRVDVRAGGVAPVTRVFTAVSGITELSPAISIAADDGALAFTVFRNAGWSIYRMDDPRPTSLERAGQSAAALPPVARNDRELSRLLGSAAGLPPDTTWPRHDYSPSLSLDRIGQPSVIAGADQFGAFVGGGAALYFSDMLSQHRLATMAQVSGDIENIGAAVGYTNLDKRFEWGATVQRLPTVSRGLQQGFVTVDGTELLLQRRITYRRVQYGGTLVGSYPFSSVFRAEATGGYRHVRFEREVRDVLIAPNGQIVQDSTTETSPFESLNLGTASAALVYDDALFSPTSPIVGSRLRLEGTPIIGSLDYLEALADLRHYFLPVRPVTFAVRVLHFGRWGGDADDERLRDVFVGYSGLMRGYQSGTFDPEECEATDDDPCPILTRLSGSRMLVANAELRFPLLGILGVGDGYTGAFPIELAFFGDAGVAWRNDDASTAQNEQAFFLGGDRDPVFSAGVSTRVNVFGFAIVQLSLARAFERDRWVFQWSLVPGF